MDIKNGSAELSQASRSPQSLDTDPNLVPAPGVWMWEIFPGGKGKERGKYILKGGRMDLEGQWGFNWMSRVKCCVW